MQKRTECKQLFKSLAWKCFERGLDFSYSETVGQIEIRHVVRDSDGEYQFTEIDQGYIEDWKHDTRVEVLQKLHESVNKFTLEAEERAKKKGLRRTKQYE